MKGLIAVLLDNKHVVGLIFLATIILAGTTALGLQIEPDFSALISEDSTYNTNERILEQTYQENSGVILFYDIQDTSVLKDVPDTLNTTRFTEHTSRLEQALRDSQYVTSITGPTLSESGRNAYTSVGLYVPNGVNTFKDVKNELDRITEAVPPPPGVDVEVSGLPTILDRTATLLITDNITTVFITVALVFLILYWYFQDIRLALIGMAAPVVSVVSLAAIMVILDINVTLTLAAVGVLIIGLGADYSVHLTVAFERHLREGERVREAVLDAVEELWLPITASFLTTLAGFLALIFGSGPSSYAQGVVLSIGIMIIYLVTFLCIPVLLSLASSTYNEEKNKWFEAAQDYLARIAVFQGNNPVAVIVLVLVITAGFGYGASYVYFSTSNSNWIPEDDPVSQSFNEYQYTFGSSDSLTVLVRADDGDLRSPSHARDIQRLAAQLEGITSVDRVTHPFQDVDLSQPGIVRHTEQPRISSQFNQDYTLTTIQLQSQYFDVDESGESVILREVRGILDTAPDGMSYSIYGDAVRFEELGQSLQSDTGRTTVVGLVLVAVIATATYASITVGFSALLPILIALVWAVGLMGITGVPFTSLSTGLLSLVLGIGVDFSIHIVDSIDRYLKEHRINEAIRRSLTTSGSAIVLSSLTTLFGFLALSFSSLLGTRRFGWSLALSILAVFTVTILLVPAIMSLRHRLQSKEEQ